MDCDQCGKPAIINVNHHPLCVSCYSLLQQTETARVEANNDYLRLLSAQMNHSLSQMEMAVGIPLGLERVQIPQKAKQFNSVHNVNVQGSTVGAINTGEAQSIAVAINTSKEHGNRELASALENFTSELTKSNIEQSQKQEMNEQLAALAEEVSKPAETRRKGVILPMLDGLSKAVSVSTALVQFWGQLEPLLKQTFGV